ncbi:MAG TPA: 30S ribosomal protein S14 [Nautiliaceae bacterium]|nr:30S ribosomal protein S14 [Nautiliaceae bacterium]
MKHNAKKKKKCTVGYCQRCGNTRAFNSKYGINLCRHCLREVLPQIGFKKY